MSSKNTLLICISFIAVFFGNHIYCQEWKKVYSSFNPPGDYDMSYGTFTDEKNGWFTEHYPGRIWHTSDGGLTWKKQKDSSRVWTYDIEFVDSLHGWVVGENIGESTGFILRTTDGGNSWDTISTLYVSGVTFFNTSIGFAGNDSIYRTIDGGVTWQAQTIEPQRRYAVRDIFFIDPKYGWAVGSSGVADDIGAIVHTIDSGNNWYGQQPETEMLNRIYFINRQIGFSVGLNIFVGGVMLKTTDGGDNWDYVNIQSPRINDITFTSDSTGWAIGDYGYIWQTNDGGNSWDQYATIANHDLHRIVFVDDDNVGYIFGDDNTLLKYDKTENIIDDDFDVLTKYRLSQNYPNPFNATTTIQYEIPKISHVTLTIYNLNGQLVERLVNRKQEAGKYSFSWSAADVPTGIYFYRLQAGNKCQTRKMMVMK